MVLEAPPRGVATTVASTARECLLAREDTANLAGRDHAPADGVHEADGLKMLAAEFTTVHLVIDAGAILVAFTIVNGVGAPASAAGHPVGGGGDVLDQLLLPEEELVASLGPSLDLFGYFVLGYSGVDHLFILCGQEPGG
jgi:hypothetical protein